MTANTRKGPPAPPDDCQPIVDKRARPGGLTPGLWLGVLVGFACLFAAYFFAFRASHAAQIQEVPLAPRGGRP